MPATASRSQGKGARGGGESATRRRAYQQAESLSFGDGSSRWLDTKFFIQVEHCGGTPASAAFSVRLEGDLYQKKAQALKQDLDQFFEGSIEVVLVEVPTLYALEVRVMRDKHHPRHGSAVFGEEACAQGAKTLFSKVASKKWPKIDDLCAQLQEFTRIPVSMRVLCTELPPGVEAAPIPGAENGMGDPLFPLENLTLKVFHSTGTEHRCSTDEEGRAMEVLFPGKFSCICDPGCHYDRLDPGEIEVPSLFRPLQLVLLAKMKKACSFEVVDHLDKPFRNFPLKITRRKRTLGAEPVELVTKGHGRVKGRLGVGLHIASYGGPEEFSPVEPLAHDLEVLDIDGQQSFRICVQRCRFLCEIALHTRFNEPARGCPFVVRSGRKRLQAHIAKGITSSTGMARVELPPGKLVFALEPEGESPYVPMQFELQVGETGDFEPRSHKVETKSVNVSLSLMTPYGEPAPFCDFELRACFRENGTLADEGGMSFCSDEQGQVLVALELLEPFVFSVKPSGSGSEYIPQDISFLTDRQSLTIVVVRSLLGKIAEDSVVFVVDTSGSMQAYLDDVTSAVNLALIQQFHKTGRRFNILTFTDYQVEFQDDLVDATPKNVEAAMQFCQHAQAGGISNLSAALRLAFAYKRAEAIYLITDGESDVTEDLLTQVQVQYLSHPMRPRLHTVGINCAPGGARNRGLQKLAQLTSGCFRAPCLEQDTGETLLPGVSKHDKVKGLDLMDAQFATTNQDTGDLLPRGGRPKDANAGDASSATTGEDSNAHADEGSETEELRPKVETMFRIVGFRVPPQ
ncbi:VWA3A [Symbiodinium sp. CCMP2456]|nr:VWA3A [Symbiodinium sp. CCMP2456]